MLQKQPSQELRQSKSRERVGLKPDGGLTVHQQQQMQANDIALERAMREIQ